MWKPPFIYFHICMLGPYKEIVTEMIRIIEESGLLEKCEELRYVVTGEREGVDEIREIMGHSKCRLYGFHEDIGRYERTTLNMLYQDALQESGYRPYLYLHSKGVSRKNYQENIKAWRNLMLFYLVENHQSCLETMYFEQLDAVGCLYRTQPSRHFSGNFWWTHNKYISQLNREIGGAYLDPEMWIGRKLCRGLSWYQHPSVLYHVHITRDMYNGSPMYIGRMPNIRYIADGSDKIYYGLLSDHVVDVTERCKHVKKWLICNEILGGDPCFGQRKYLYVSNEMIEEGTMVERVKTIYLDRITEARYGNGTEYIMVQLNKGMVRICNETFGKDPCFGKLKKLEWKDDGQWYTLNEHEMIHVM